MNCSLERQRLLGLVADLIIESGLHDLSLSGIARSIGSNNRMLLYYFGSRDHLLQEACDLVVTRFPMIDSIFERLRDDLDLEIRLQRAWDAIGDPENRLLIRAFFQIFARALYASDENAGFLAGITQGWVGALAEILEMEGHASEAATLAATEIVALWRGLQMALVAGEAHETLSGAHHAAICALLTRLDREKAIVPA